MKMKLSNLLILVISMSFSSLIMAATDQDTDLKTERDRQTSNIRERIQILEGRLGCIQKAKDFNALESCNDAADKKIDILESKIQTQEGNKKGNHNNKHSDTKNKHD